MGRGIFAHTLQDKIAVVKANIRTDRDIVIETGIGDTKSLVGSKTFRSHINSDFFAGLESRFAAFELSRSNFGSLGIQADGDDDVFFFFDFAKSRNLVELFLMIAMREIEPHACHAVLEKLCEHFFSLAGRSDSTDDFCFLVDSVIHVSLLVPIQNI